MPIPYQIISISDRLISFGEALERQYSLQRARQYGEIPDTLILLEHPPVITLGRSSVSERDLLTPTTDLIDRGIEIHEADRGGEITYHAPGQLIGYPIIELNEAAGERDLHKYLRNIETVIINTLAIWGVDGERKNGLTGVWIGENKIAAIGIKVSRWITMHGFALNISCDLTPMRKDIVPCGISDLGVTSLNELGLQLCRKTVEPVIIRQFEQIFDRIQVI